MAGGSPIVGTFKGDFANFLTQIDKANVAVVDFGKSAKPVEKALNQMVDNFSGRKLIQEASLMTIAVEKAGGVATLTGKEIEQVGLKANAAADKIRALGYEVPAGLQNLANETKATSSTFDTMATSIKGVASAFGLVFGAQAVIGFGKQLLADADALVKLHDKTGISIEGLQKFQIAGDDAGNTLDEITAAITKMEDKLVSGDKSAVAAVQKLGLNFDELKKLTPEQQFEAISEAIKKIPDPAERVNIAIDLFGKAGATVLPTLLRGFEDLGDAAGLMSEDTVRALDEAGDALDRYWRATKGVAANIIVTFEHMRKAASEALSTPTGDHSFIPDGAALDAQNLAGATQSVREQFEKMLPAVHGWREEVKGTGVDEKDLDEKMKLLDDGLNKQLGAVTKLTAEEQRLGKEKDALYAKVSKLEVVLPGLTHNLGEMKTNVSDTLPPLVKYHDQLDKIERSSWSASFGTKGLSEGLDKVGQKVDPLGGKVLVFVDAVEKASKASEIFHGSIGKLLSGITGGGGLGGALENIGKGFIDGIGKALSGGLASLVNFGIGQVANFFGKLFGNPEKQVNPIREAFVQAAGGLDTLNQKAAAAGVTLDAMLNAKNPEQYKKAIDDLNAAFNLSDQALKAADDTVAKFGLTVDELGPKFKQQKLDEQAAGLVNDYRLLDAVAKDHSITLEKLAPSVNAYISSILKAGGTVPEELKDPIKQMRELGLLTDDSGQAFSDAQLDGLTFAKTLDEKFTGLLDSIQKLVDSLNRQLGPAINNLPSEHTVHVGFQVDDAPDFGGRSGNFGSPIFAAGGYSGDVSQPTLFVAGEAGREHVQIGPPGGNSGQLDEMLSLFRMLPKMIRDAVILGDMSLKPTVLVEVELSGVGGGWTNIARDVIRQSSIVIRSGIAGGGPSDRVAGSPSATFKLNNSTLNSAGLLGYYSPFHASKRSGWALGIKCRIRLTDPNTAATTTRFIGRIDQIIPAAGQKGPRTVDVVVVGWMDEAARWTLTPEIGEQVGKSWDQILTAILAQMPRQPEATSFDVGVEAYPYALVTSEQTKQTALGEFAKLAASEVGLIYEKADGTLRGEGRHQRLLDTTSDWTITDAEESGLVLPSTRDQIINTVRTQGHPQVVDEFPTTRVYNQANTIEVGPAETQMLLGAFTDPVTGNPIGATEVVVTPTFTANAAEDGSGADVSADFTFVTTFGPSGIRSLATNGGAAVDFLTSLKFFGRGVYDYGVTAKEATDATSIAAFGEHAVLFDMPYQADDDVIQGAADYFLARYKDSSALVQSVTVFGRSTAALAQILALDISSRLTLSETVTGASALSFFINGIELTVTPAGSVKATYTLAPAADPFSGLYWILGTSVLGTDTVPAPF